MTRLHDPIDHVDEEDPAPGLYLDAAVLDSYAHALAQLESIGARDRNPRLAHAVRRQAAASRALAAEPAPDPHSVEACEHATGMLIQSAHVTCERSGLRQLLGDRIVERFGDALVVYASDVAMCLHLCSHLGEVEDEEATHEQLRAIDPSSRVAFLVCVARGAAFGLSTRPEPRDAVALEAAFADCLRHRVDDDWESNSTVDIVVALRATFEAWIEQADDVAIDRLARSRARNVPQVPGLAVELNRAFNVGWALAVAHSLLQRVAREQATSVPLRARPECWLELLDEDDPVQGRA